MIPGTAIRIRDTLEGDVVTETGFRPPLPRINLTEQDINRWNMAKRAAESNPASKLEDESRLVDYNLPFRRRCRDGSDLFCIFKIPTATGFSAAAVVYGGLHALAWFAHFGSPTQQLLWRICVCGVMGGAPALHLIMKLLGKMPDWSDWSHIPILILIGAMVLAYRLARVYLVIECFVQLSCLPEGVYVVPNWTAYFPHIA